MSARGGSSDRVSAPEPASFGSGGEESLGPLGTLDESQLMQLGQIGSLDQRQLMQLLQFITPVR